MFRRFTSLRAVSLLVVTAAAVLGLSLDLEPPSRAAQARPTSAEVAPLAELTQEELVEQLMPNLSEEHMRKELGEQMDALPAEMKAALPPGFKQKFVDKFIKEGLPELKASTAKGIKETYTEDELRALLDFRRKYPDIVKKQETLTKAVLKQSMEIGQRIGKSLAQ